MTWILLNYIRDVRLVGIVVTFAQPAVIAGVGGDTVQTQFFVCWVNFVEEAMKRENTRTLYFVEYIAPLLRASITATD